MDSDDAGFAHSWRSFGSERDILANHYSTNGALNMSERYKSLKFMNYFGFGYGGIGQYIWGLLFGFFMTPFLIQVAKISPFAAGTLQLVASIWTAIINPFIGILSDISPYPRRLSWIIFSIVPFCWFYMLFWFVPPFLSDTGLIFYYTIVYLICATAFMCYVVPYNSLSAEISPHYDERTKLSTYRWVLSLVIGIVAIAGQSIIVYSFKFPDGSFNLVKGYAVSGIIMSIFLLSPGVVLYFTVSEPKPNKNKIKRTSILKGLSLTLTNFPFIMVVLLNSCAWSALSLLTNNLLLYITFVVQEEHLFPFILICLLICCTIGLPLWATLSYRVGKKLVYFLGTLLLVIAIFPTTFLESGDIILLFILPSFGGFGLGVLYLIPYSMVPDVVEYDELTSGERREGSFFSIFIFCEKLATGVTLAFSNYTLGALGFNANLPSQPENVITVLRLLVGVGPCIVLILSWIACWFYPITKQKHAETLKQLVLVRESRRT